MKKLSLTLVAIIISCFVFAQVEIRGVVSLTNRCELLDEGGYKVLKTTPQRYMKIRLNDNEFVVNGYDYRLVFPLTDKMVDSSDNKLVVNYLSSAYKKLWMIAAKECDGKLIIGVFPMDGKTKFTEYIVPNPRRAK